MKTLDIRLNELYYKTTDNIHVRIVGHNAAAMFLIVELQNIFYLHIPQVMYYLPPLNGKLNTDFTRLPV